MDHTTSTAIIRDIFYQKLKRLLNLWNEVSMPKLHLIIYKKTTTICCKYNCALCREKNFDIYTEENAGKGKSGE